MQEGTKKRHTLVAVALLSSTCLSGCIYLGGTILAGTLACDVTKCMGTGEERFVKNTSSMIGRNIESHRYEPETIVDVDERTQEYWYRCCSKTCRYSYIVDRRSRRVTALRYSGDCNILFE